MPLLTGCHSDCRSEEQVALETVGTQLNACLPSSITFLAEALLLHSVGSFAASEVRLHLTPSMQPLMTHGARFAVPRNVHTNFNQTAVLLDTSSQKALQTSRPTSRTRRVSSSKVNLRCSRGRSEHRLPKASDVSLLLHPCAC